MSDVKVWGQSLVSINIDMWNILKIWSNTLRERQNDVSKTKENQLYLWQSLHIFTEIPTKDVSVKGPDLIGQLSFG